MSGWPNRRSLDDILLASVPPGKNGIRYKCRSQILFKIKSIYSQAFNAPPSLLFENYLVFFNQKVASRCFWLPDVFLVGPPIIVRWGRSLAPRAQGAKASWSP